MKRASTLQGYLVTFPSWLPSFLESICVTGPSISVALQWSSKKGEISLLLFLRDSMLWARASLGCGWHGGEDLLLSLITVHGIFCLTGYLSLKKNPRTIWGPTWRRYDLLSLIQTSISQILYYRDFPGYPCLAKTYFRLDRFAWNLEIAIAPLPRNLFFPRYLSFPSLSFPAYICWPTM